MTYGKPHPIWLTLHVACHHCSCQWHPSVHSDQQSVICGCCAAGFVCCNVNLSTGACTNDAVFNIQAWVSTKGYWESGKTNDGAVLLVSLASTATLTPIPLATTSLFLELVDMELDVTASGFPAADDRFVNGPCTNPPFNGNALRAWTTFEPPLDNDICPLTDGAATGDCLAYAGSSCGGNSGGSLVMTDTNEAFAIWAAATDCGAGSGSSDLSTAIFTQIVNQAGDKGAWIEKLVEAVAAPARGSHKRRRSKRSRHSRVGESVAESVADQAGGSESPVVDIK